MTSTRRSGVSDAKASPQKRPPPPSSPPKSSRKRRKVAESENSSEIVAEDPQTSQIEASSSSRPKRTIRKSVLLSDYEVMLPSTVKEEPDDEEKEEVHPAVQPVVEEVEEQFVDIETSHADELNASMKAEERVAAVQRKSQSRRIVHPPPPPPYIEPEETNVEPEVDIEGIELMGHETGGMMTLADAIDVALEEEVSGGEEDDQPPMLEKSAERRRPRGRPRKHSPTQIIQRSRTGRLFPLPRSRYVADKAISKGEADKINNYNIKLFENEVGVTEYGDRYATVIPGCLSYLLRKERIVELLTEPSDIESIREQGWMSIKPPRLPPLVGTKACFAFYIEGSTVSSVRELSSDDLKPWTTTDPGEGEPTIKPNVRKHAVARIDGRFEPCKGDGRASEFHLTEYSAWLPRLLRLRKKIFYVARQTGQIVGNVLILYDFTMPGELPTIMNIAHGNDALRDMQQLDLAMELPVADADNPSRQSTALSTSIDKSHSSDIQGNGGVNDDFVDVEEIVDAGDENDMSMSGGQGEFEEMHEDCLDGGWDGDFDEDLLASQENSDPFIDGVRELESGHVYLTVRHKRMAGSLDTILQYIANTNFVENHDILNSTKPQHPPLVRNARAYAFFVAGNIVYPHDINRDDFSPWSGNGTPENPTCYRTKVRKFPVETDEVTGLFRIGHGDYRASPYHLVHLYSIHPKETRLRKKIAYLMETETRTIISHVMIMYDYHTEGPVPRIRGPYSKRYMRQKPRRPMIDMADTLDDVSDISESEKESPREYGLFEYESTDVPTYDDLQRNVHILHRRQRGSIMCRRPKTSKISLGLNREGQLRVMKMSRSQGTDYQMHIYAATLPRLPRLKKRVIYLTKGGMQIGHSMIVYWYTEEGALPTQVRIEDLDYIPDWLQADIAHAKKQGELAAEAAAQSAQGIVDGGDIDVSHTEEVEQAVGSPVRKDFGIEIVADNHPLLVEGESIEAMVVTDDGLVSAEIVDEGMIPEGATIENVEIVEESVVVEDHPATVQSEAEPEQKDDTPKDATGAIHIGEEVEIQSVETVETER
ncbi:hypothetical protein TELCIR_11353 [Teladorsagia circumcincta]|uniref:DUF7747 domain-containing protein n=2 Tax=Teladorsagia circumcincta TaxID=45464 RepID=A0A2G9U9L2_TELCI|nr:hypothetical protein TELCIR_11353 [Teladorsagia circumcincta]